MMGYPLLQYGLLDIENPSFEVDAVGVDPTGWDSSLSTTLLLQTNAAGYIVGGTSIAQDQCVKLSTSGAGGIGDSTIIAQRFAVSDFADLIRHYDTEFAATGMFRFFVPVPVENVKLEVRQFQGGSLTIDSGTEQVAPESRSFITGIGAAWFMYVTAVKLHVNTEYIEIRLVYEIVNNTGWTANWAVFFDHIAAGGLVDFTKGFRDFEGAGDAGYRVNEGDRVFEIVRVRGAASSITVSLRNILECSVLDEQIRAYLGSLTMSTPGRCALWGDRDTFSNAERRYVDLVTDPRQPSYTYEPGFTRRSYDLRFLAPTEYFA